MEQDEPIIESSSEAVAVNPVQKTLFIAWLGFAAIAFVLLLASQQTEVRLLASLFAICSGLSLVWRGTTFLESDRQDGQIQIIAGLISAIIWIPAIFIVII
jgi:hypothetical protein